MLYIENDNARLLHHALAVTLPTTLVVLGELEAALVLADDTRIVDAGYDIETMLRAARCEPKNSLARKVCHYAYDVAESFQDSPDDFPGCLNGFMGVCRQAVLTALESDA